DNLRAALGWSLQRSRAASAAEVGRSDVELPLRLSAALTHFWCWRGHLGEGQRWIHAVLERSRGLAAPARVKALYRAGQLACFRNDLGLAAAWSEECLELSEARGDAVGMGWSLFNLGWAADSRADFSTARPLFERSIALARQTQDGRLLGIALLCYGAMLLYQADHGQGSHAAARAPLEELVARARTVGNRRQLAAGLTWLGYQARE